MYIYSGLGSVGAPSREESLVKGDERDGNSATASK
jgi:hypothetical protein